MRTQSSRISAAIVFWKKKRKMALLTPLLAFLYHLPQVYKWLLKPYYIASLFMSSAFLLIRKTPGVCEHLSTQREDGNSCDFDWVCIKQTFGVSCWMITHITCFVTRELGSGQQMMVYRIRGGRYLAGTGTSLDPGKRLWNTLHIYICIYIYATQWWMMHVEKKLGNLFHVWCMCISEWSHCRVVSST